MDAPYPCETVVVVSANIEWQAIRRIHAETEFNQSPLGEWFATKVGGEATPVLFFHGGWGKTAAAASTQYLIDCCSPSLLINLGTCGGFRGDIERETIILVERTIVYDIHEQMGDHDEHIAHYSTDIDLDWLKQPYPHEVVRTLMVSADRDLVADEILSLKKEFGAVVGDWESGSIAWVTNRNNVRTLILRGVTDLVGRDGGEAYEGNIRLFEENTFRIMQRLVAQLPNWIRHAHVN